MAWSTPDLNNITQVVQGLIQWELDHYVPTPSNISLTSKSPDTARKTDGTCHLTLYLLHVGRDPYWRNTPVAGPRPQLNANQPLSLNLSYLLSAWCDTDAASEQLAMSIGLHAVHTHPIVTKALLQQEHLTQWLGDAEFTLSIEADTIEEMSRLWQAFATPLRLSALIKASVVFVAPAIMVPVPQPAPTVANLSVGPVPSPKPTVPLLLPGTGLTITPALPESDPAGVTSVTAPLTGAAGGTLRVLGNGLTLGNAGGLFLSIPGTATEWDASAWLKSAAQPGEVDITLPANYTDAATPVPAATPLPGFYALAVGTPRSNTIPLAIAPRVDGAFYPAQLSPDTTGLFTVSGAGFVAAHTALALGTRALTAATTPAPANGEFSINAAGTQITFRLPTPAPTKGLYPVQIQVNGIAAAPGWVVVVVS